MAAEAKPPDPLDEAVKTTSKKLREGLGGSFLRKPRRPWDAERRKLFARLHAALMDVCRLAADGHPVHEQLGRCLADQLTDARALETVDSTLECVDEIRKALIPIGDARYLTTMLVDERNRESHRKARLAGGSRRSSTLVGWSEVYPDVKLDDLLSEERDAAWMKNVVELLVPFHECRRERYRLHRARLQMKAAYLTSLGFVLLLIVVGLALVITFLAGQHGAGSPGERTMLAVLAGALGATLSGGFRLRDQLENLNELRAFAPAAAVQPLLGATAGLVLLLVFDSGVVAGEMSWPRLGLLAFAAGFSEPFFLGVVRRITTAGDEGGRAPDK